MALHCGQVEPQQKVFADPPISVDGDLDDIHPMRRGGVKSFVDDLVLGRGVVISRAATSLRSVETQPLTRRFVRNWTNNISVSMGCALRTAPVARACLVRAAGQNQTKKYQHVSVGTQVRLLPRAFQFEMSVLFPFFGQVGRLPVTHTDRLVCSLCLYLNLYLCFQSRWRSPCFVRVSVVPNETTAAGRSLSFWCQPK